ncbi:MAG: hypothetical protein ACI4ET_11250 [Bilifractor sp.]
MLEQDEFIPNSKYLRPLQEKKPLKRGPVPVEECRQWLYGATYLLDQIGDKLGITDESQGIVFFTL